MTARASRPAQLRNRETKKIQVNTRRTALLLPFRFGGFGNPLFGSCLNNMHDDTRLGRYFESLDAACCEFCAMCSAWATASARVGRAYRRLPVASVVVRCRVDGRRAPLNGGGPGRNVRMSKQPLYTPETTHSAYGAHAGWMAKVTPARYDASLGPDAPTMC
jgi:hypothetical protein